MKAKHLVQITKEVGMAGYPATFRLAEKTGIAHNSDVDWYPDELEIANMKYELQSCGIWKSSSYAIYTRSQLRIQLDV